MSGNTSPRRKLYVLLTKPHGVRSGAVGLATRFYYTHSSIGLEEDPNTFYSFVCKGFIVEKIDRYLKPDRAPFPCKLYELEVSEETYERVREVIMTYVENRADLRYTWFGVITSIFHIPFRQKNHYFCSQFVAEVLDRSQAARLKKSCALYHPRDFKNIQGMKELFQGNLQLMREHFLRQACLA